MTVTPGNDDDAARSREYDPGAAYPPVAHPSTYGGYVAPQVHVRPSNGVATAGGVCGIVAASISWIPLVNVFSLVLSIIAVALGAVGLSRSNKLRQEIGEPVGRGMAITGIVIGCVGLVIALIFIVALGSALNDLSHTPTATIQ